MISPDASALTVEAAQSSDGRLYECLAENPAGEAQTAALLIVRLRGRSSGQLCTSRLDLQIGIKHGFQLSTKISVELSFVYDEILYFQCPQLSLPLQEM